MAIILQRLETIKVAMNLQKQITIWSLYGAFAYTMSSMHTHYCTVTGVEIWSYQLEMRGPLNENFEEVLVIGPFFGGR